MQFGVKVGRSNLAARYIVQKSRQSSKAKVKGQGRQGQKNEKKLLSHPQAVRRAHQAATDDTISCRPGMTGYAGVKINACCLVSALSVCLSAR